MGETEVANIPKSKSGLVFESGMNPIQEYDQVLALG